jgi:hypothetical protein
MEFLHKTTLDGSASYLVYEEDFSHDSNDIAYYFGSLEMGDDSWFRFRPSGNLITPGELQSVASKLSELNHEQWQATQYILKNLT